MIFDEVKTSLSERVSEVLIEKIKEGRWVVELPGIRVLCDETGVSRQTMMKAVRYLEVNGVVSAPRPGKARLILGRVDEGEQVSDGEPRIVILSNRSEDDLDRLNRMLVQSMKGGLLKKGYQCIYVVLPSLSSPTGGDEVEGVMVRNPADLYITLEAHEFCQRKMDELEVSVIYLGGSVLSSKNPNMLFPLGDRGRLALRELVKRKHERIVFFLPMSMQGEGEELSFVEGKVQEAYESMGLKYSLYNTPRWKDDCYIALKKSFELTPPTAVVLAESMMVPAMVSVLMEKGLFYPKDVSVICLDDHPMLARFHPPVSTIMSSPESFVDQVLRMVGEMSLVGLPSGAYSGDISLSITESVSDLSGT